MGLLTRVIIALYWLALGAAPLHAAVVEDLRSYRAPDHTRLVFDLSEPVDHKIFTLDSPHRLVVDLRAAALRGELGSAELADTPITAVRSAPRNDGDLRVVFDLRAGVKPRSFLLGPNEQYGDRLVIDLHDLDKAPATQARGAVSSLDLANGRRDIVVAISAGHGGEDPGAIGVDHLQEKQVVLALARELANELRRIPGYRPVLIRDGDYYVDLRKRTEIAHASNADLFVAIHADAFTNSRAQGATVYALSQRGATSEQARRLAEKENAADLIGGVGSVSLNDKDAMLASVLLDLSMTASIAASLEVGDRIIDSLGRVVDLRRRKVEQAAFVVLKSPDIPSLLIEAGYITNPRDARNLNSAAWRRTFAEAVATGITGWFHDKPPRGTLVAWQKENGGNSQRYRVARGDSLSLIAQRFQLSLAQLRAANGLRDDTIFVGQDLTIPVGGGAGNGVGPFLEHTISRGETLSGIATAYSVPLERIRETNALNSDTIRVGQVLKIPTY